MISARGSSGRRQDGALGPESPPGLSMLQNHPLVIASSNPTALQIPCLCSSFSSRVGPSQHHIVSSCIGCLSLSSAVVEIGAGTGERRILDSFSRSTREDRNPENKHLAICRLSAACAAPVRSSSIPMPRSSRCRLLGKDLGKQERSTASDRTRVGDRRRLKERRITIRQISGRLLGRMMELPQRPQHVLAERE